MRGRTAKETASFTYVGNKYDARETKKSRTFRGKETKSRKRERAGKAETSSTVTRRQEKLYWIL